MKTISSRFLKASLAMLLVVVMLFGSTITGFAAVVDKAETGANTVAGGYVYFDNTLTKWTDSCIQFVIGHSGFSRTYTMSKITNTNLYYVNLSSSQYHDWGDATYYAVIGTSSKWGDGNWGSSNLTNATHRTAAYTTAYNMDGDTKRHLVTPTSSSNGTTIGIAYQGTTFGSVNKTNYVYVKSAAAGSTTYNNSSSAGTAKITGYYLSNNNVASSHSATTTLNSTYTANCTIAPATSITLAATANTGYKFVGWYTSSGTLVSTNASCTTAFAGATTYHARFEEDAKTYTITYNANGGSGAPAAGSVKDGNSYTVSSTKPTKTGYTFKNWNTAANGSGTSYASGATISNVKADITLYAQYDINTYTVTYDANGGTGAPANQTKTYGEDLTLSSTTPTPASSKATFVGWNTKADGSGTAYMPGDKYTTNAALTLYAQYEQSVFTATFKDWDGTELDTQEINKNETPDAPEVDRKGYRFTGWTPSVGPMTKDTVFTATYEAINYTITFDTDGADAIDPITYTIDTETFELPTPERTGYNFTTWVDADGNEYLEIPTGSTGDLELTAIYKIKTYTISVEVSPAGTGEATVSDGSSATVEHGQEVTLKAVAKDGYRFHSWMINGREVSFVPDFTVAPEDDATYTATFEKIWNVTVAIPEGINSVTYQGGTVTSTTTYEKITHGWSSPFTASVKEGYKLIGWDITKNGTTTRYNTEAVNVTADADTTITPVVEKLYYAVVNGKSPTATDYFVKGQEVTLSFTVPTGKYLASVSVEPAMELEVNVDKAAGKVTFTMPEANVTLVPDFEPAYTVTFNPDVFTSTTKKDYYYPGEPVEITVTPKGGHLITSITSEQTDVTYANKVITFTMPAENVTLDVEYSASFKAYSDVITVHIDNPAHTYEPVDGGTVTMTCNGATLAEGGFADGDVTYTATPKSTDYTFVGFYSDYNCTKFITDKTTYTVSPESDVTLYALFARKQYIRISGYSFYEMAFDRNQKAYTMVYTLGGSTAVGTASITQALFNSGFDFDVHYNKNATNHAYYGFGSANFTVDMNSSSYGRSISWGPDRWHVSGAQANTSFPLTITIKPSSVHTYNKIDVSAQTSKNGYDVILSSGRYKVGDANVTILTEGVTGTHITPGAHNGDKEEYKKIYLSEQKTISWELEVGADDYLGFSDKKAAGTVVNTFVVYKMRSKTFQLVKPVELGSNKYQGTVVVDEDCYIVPVFFHTPEYVAENDLVSIELYFDATAIQGRGWGPFVAAYAWGSEAYLGEWPGQMLIPSEDGTSFYTQLDVPAAGSENPAAGITFSNYLFNTCPTLEQSLFGLGDKNVQTYDYREAITLYEAGYEAITFVAKDSLDGYHGDSNDGSNTSNTISSSTTGIKDKYEFEILVDRNGDKAMDFTGKPVEDTAPVKDVSNADYYIVTKGDVIYKEGNYAQDAKFDGEWCVDWYVFDNTGKYITKVLSNDFWHDKNTEDDIHESVLMEKLGLTPETAAGKTIAISYEAANNCPKVNGHNDSHQLAFDGQWYGNMLSDKMTGQVIVGLDDGNNNFTLETDETLNIGETTGTAFYGEAYLKDLQGGLHQTLDIEMEYGTADLTATPGNGYRFIGWYTLKPDGSYIKLDANTAYSTYINSNTTYYAIFRELGEHEVSITHARYVNDDPAIPSHDGVGELSVEIMDSEDKVVATGPIGTSGTTATFEAKEGETYTVKIITTPLMKGKFFAWYTDSVKADGTKTYEEVFTEPDHIGQETTVFAEFEYMYDTTDPDLDTSITIYSDIRKVSNKAKIYYQYLNRFNVTRVYSTTVTLTDDECMGYVGNDGKEYCPTWLTLCTFLNESTGDVIEEYVKPNEVAAKTKEMNSKGYQLVDTYNLIEALAPTEDVTEVFNGTVEWDVSVNLTASESEVRLTAKQGAPEYTITYYIGKGTDEMITDSFTNTYNELVEIDAPAFYNGKEFSYWYDETTQEIAAYTTYYNYRIAENKTLVAVYGEKITQDWTPSINSVTYTREFGDNKDVIYTDYLLAYNNKDGKILNEWKKTDNIKYGLLVVRDSAYYISDSSKVTYPDSTNAAIKEKLKLVANRGSSAAFTVDNTKYNCYCYDLTNEQLTNFNRCDYYRSYDNRAVVGGSHYYREYAFTAVAYIIVNGEVFLSNPREVNFFDLGNEVPTNPVQ